jgi:AbiV family abortive infection protein
MKKRLNQYRGRLGATDIAKGITVASKNSVRLAQDANMLLDAGRYPSATALAILSIEESGKISILRELAIANDEKTVAQCWRSYRSHTQKNVAWLLPQLVGEGARRLDDFRTLFDDDAEHPFILDQLKQISFYSDCLGKNNWSNPTEVIDENLARAIVSVANIMSKENEVQPLEIELWIKHLGPVWMLSDGAMKKGLENWYEEMQEKGLASEGENEMKKFIRNGVSDSKPDGS